MLFACFLTSQTGRGFLFELVFGHLLHSLMLMPSSWQQLNKQRV